VDEISFARSDEDDMSIREDVGVGTQTMTA